MEGTLECIYLKWHSGPWHLVRNSDTYLLKGPKSSKLHFHPGSHCCRDSLLLYRAIFVMISIL